MSEDQLPAVVDHRPLTVSEIKTHVGTLQQVMKSCMQTNHHFGVIPGCKKPSLWKPGAEMICSTFHLSPHILSEDVEETEGSIRVITRIALFSPDGVNRGEGSGLCESNEEKYKWRKAVCDEEWENTPEDMRRIKYGKSRGDVYKVSQIRTNHADLANTILKMAYKRALVAATLVVTGASDIFTQDVEDMPQEVINPSGKTGDSAPPRTTQSAPPRSKPAPKADDEQPPCKAPTGTKWYQDLDGECASCGVSLRKGDWVLRQFKPYLKKCERCGKGLPPETPPWDTPAKAPKGTEWHSDDDTVLECKDCQRPLQKGDWILIHLETGAGKCIECGKAMCEPHDE